MSGSPRIVSLAADADGVVARLVHAAGLFGQAALPPWALVGGLAVMVQLAEAHRATADVDTVADDDADELAPALAVLAAEQHGTATGTRVVLEDGTKIDVITTGSWATSDLPEDDLDRVFVLGHWWAVQTADAIVLRVVDGATSTAEANITVATPAARPGVSALRLAGRRWPQSKQSISRSSDRCAPSTFSHLWAFSQGQPSRILASWVLWATRVPVPSHMKHVSSTCLP